MSKKFQPTAEQLALAEDRRLKKEQRKQAAAKEEEEKGRILPREWTSVQGASGPENAGQKVRLMTWNVGLECSRILQNCHSWSRLLSYLPNVLSVSPVQLIHD